MGLPWLLDEKHFWIFLKTLLGCLHTNSKWFWISCMSVSLLVCYFSTEIRQIWGYLYFWMTYLSEIFLRHSLDIGSLVFTLFGWAYILSLRFCVLVLTLKPLILLPFGCLGVSFWDLLVLFEERTLKYKYFPSPAFIINVQSSNLSVRNLYWG